MPKRILILLFSLLMPLAVFVGLMHQQNHSTHNLSDTYQYAKSTFIFNVDKFKDNFVKTLDKFDAVSWDITDYERANEEYLAYIGRIFKNLGVYVWGGLQLVYFLISFSFNQIKAVFDITWYLVFLD